MKPFKTTLIVATLIAASASFAQPADRMQHQPGERIIKVLNLDATRAAQVTTIMTEAQAQRRAVFESMQGKRGDSAAREAARAQMKTIGDNTKARLATVLNADEMAKLKDARKEMRRHGHGHGPMRG